MEVEKLDGVMQIVKIRRSTIMVLIDQGEFPLPFNVTKGIQVWDVSDLHIWLAEKKKIATEKTETKKTKENK